MKRALGLLLILATGCASIHQGDLPPSPGKLSTDGYYTLAGSLRLKPAELRDYYLANGSAEAAIFGEEAGELFSAGRHRFWRDFFIGAGLGVGAAYAFGRMPGESYSSNSLWPLYAVPVIALAVPIGIWDASRGKQRALPKLRTAAETYNGKR